MNTEIEIWKDIPGYEGLYQCSNLGKIRSCRSLKLMKPYPVFKNGYLMTGLCKDKIKVRVYFHHLVCLCFLDHKPNGHLLVIDHINNNKLDNRLSNLQLISHRQNITKDIKSIKKRTSDYVGVYFNKVNKKFISRIRLNKKHIYLGSYDLEIEAHEAYQNALKSLLK